MKKWFLFAAVGVLVIILMALGLRKPALQDEIALPDLIEDSSAPQSDDLDALIVSIGHEHIPGLLPGIETPN